MTVPTRDPSMKPAPEAEAVARDPMRAEDPDALLVSRAALQAMVHDLRNHLNTILMNAGVVARLCEDREKAARFVANFEQEGERAANTLRAVSDRYL